jgi:hypothetical protein
MAQSFRPVAPGIIRLREGGGCMAVFGFPFFCAGIFLLLAGVGVLPITNADQMSGFARPVFLLMGLAFTGVGGALVFGRAWVTLDATRGIMLREWGLLWPMHAQSHRLDGFTAVTLGFEEGDSDTADKFPVRLKSTAGADLPISSSTQYAEARAIAADVARHLRLDIEDASSDHPVRLSPDHAELSLQHRLRLAHDTEVYVDRPPTARSEVTTEADGVRISIPLPRMHPIAFALMLLPIALPVFMLAPLSQFFRQTQTPGIVGWVFLSFLVLMFGVLPASGALHAFLSSRLGRTIVTVSMAGIRIRQRKVWRTKTLAAHDASDIMDIDFSTTDSFLVVTNKATEQQVMRYHRLSSPPVVGERTQKIITALSKFAKGRGITIKTRQGLTTVGQGLADDEIRYLHSVVRRALVG